MIIRRIAATVAASALASVCLVSTASASGPYCQHDVWRYSKGRDVVSVERYRSGRGSVRIRAAVPGPNPLLKATQENRYAEVMLPRGTTSVRVYVDGHRCEPT